MRILDIFKKILNPPVVEKVVKPASPQNLVRKEANIKVAWVPADNITKQKIMVLANGDEIINKDLDKDAQAFSFAGPKKGKIKVYIWSYNNTYSNPTVLEFDI